MTVLTSAQEFLVKKDILSLAKDIGWKKYLHIGRMSIPELELSFANACLTGESAMYTNNPQMRLRRHLLLYWGAGWFKSSILLFFLNECCRARNIIQSRDTKRDVTLPTYLIVENFSKAKLRGSAEGKNLRLPVIQEARFIISTELMNFLGNDRESVTDTINYMNPLLEEGVGQVGLMKLAKVVIDDETARWLKEQNIIFDSVHDAMRYQVNGTFLATSRPFNEVELRILKDTGFLDRMKTVEWVRDRKEESEQYISMASTIDESSTGASFLAELNTILWRTKVWNIYTPPKSFVGEILRKLDERFGETEDSLGIPKLEGIRSARDIVTVSGIITAHAFLNLYKRAGFCKEYESLKYNESDAIFAAGYMNDLVDTRLRTVVMPGDKSSRDYDDCLKVREELGAVKVPLTEVVESLRRLKGVSKVYCYRRVNTWFKNDWIRFELEDKFPRAKTVVFKI